MQEDREDLKSQQFKLPLDPQKEIRIVDPNTGGAKGSKLAAFSLIPPDVVWEIAEHYGKGNAKYPPDEDGTPNWRKGYDWGLSLDALERHLHQWKMGEEIDEETGSHHLIAVIWHAIALRWFSKRKLGRDCRRALRDVV